MTQAITAIDGADGQLADYRTHVARPVDQDIAERNRQFCWIDDPLIGMVDCNDDITFGCEIFGQPGHEAIPAIIAVGYDNEREALSLDWRGLIDRQAGYCKFRPLAVGLGQNMREACGSSTGLWYGRVPNPRLYCPN